MSAKYGHQGFASLYANADAIVVGEIVEVTSSEFGFRSDEVFRSSAKAPLKAGSVIRIARFRNWQCASRWMGYKKGQYLLLFLRHSEATAARSPSWRALGAAAEGEMPIEKDQLYVGAVGDGSPIAESHVVYGATYPSRVFALKKVLEALRSGAIPEELLRAPLHAAEQPDGSHPRKPLPASRSSASVAIACVPPSPPPSRWMVHSL